MSSQGQVVSIKLKGSTQFKLTIHSSFPWIGTSESNIFEAKAMYIYLLTYDLRGKKTPTKKKAPCRGLETYQANKRVVIPSGKSLRKTECQCKSQYNYICMCLTLRSAVIWKHSRQELRFNLETKLRKLKTYYKPVQLQQLHSPRPKTP